MTRTTGPAGTTELVLFDLDDTLFAHRRAVEVGIASHLAAAGVTSIEPGEVTRWNDLEEHHYHRYLTGELDYLGQRRARARDFGHPYGLTFPHDVDAERWFEEYLHHYRAAWQLHDDTLPCLSALDALGIRTGIITNGDPDFQHGKLVAIGLDGRFEHVVASGALGITKPDPRIFAHTCELFGVPPSAAVYVGDRLNTDAVGAAAAGLWGVWLNRAVESGDSGGAAPGGAATTDEVAAAVASGVTVISTLAELPPLL